jgi:hypothetical protein
MTSCRQALPWLPLALACLGMPALVQAGPAAYEQKQGAALLRIEGEALEQGRPVVALSGKLAVTLTVEGPPLPAGDVTPFGGLPEWGVEAEAPQTQTIAGGRMQWQRHFRLDPRNAGNLVLQPEPLVVGDRTITWEPITVTVSTQVTRADPKEAHDVLPPEQPPEPPSFWPRWLPWAGVPVAAALLVLVWIRLFRRKRDEPPPVPPHEWALAELKRIEALNLPASGESNRYHTLLSEVIRRYLGRQFNLPASRQTTAEFLRRLPDDCPLTPAQRGLLAEFLERCDLAKFAPITPPPEECRAAADLACAFVEQTAPTSSPLVKATLPAAGPGMNP